MENSDICRAILSAVYKEYFSTHRWANLNEICEKGGWEPDLFWKIVDRMTYDELIHESGIGGHYTISPIGIIHAEQQDFLPEEIVERNQSIRTNALDLLAKTYEEHGEFGRVPYNRICEVTGEGERIVIENLSLLEDLGYVDSIGISYSITHEGIDVVEEWRKRVSIAERYEEISEMQPQARGREFQKLLAVIFEHQGWNQEESVRTSHEEIDIIVYREREYYLIECKWETDPIEAGVVRAVYAKLGNRDDVRGGIVISMSGFAKGAIEQAREYVGQRLILLFGPEDVHSLIRGQITFDDLLNEKSKRLVMKREIIFE